MLRKWPGESFARELERAIEALPADALPLRLAASHSGCVEDHGHVARLLTVHAKTDCILARFGVFFREILPACSCGDEPQFLDAYCELTLEIDRRDGGGRFALISDSME